MCIIGFNDSIAGGSFEVMNSWGIRNGNQGFYWINYDDFLVFYAEIFSGIVEFEGKVHCFEPDVTNFKHLKKRCNALSNVSINNKAVADKTQTLKIYTSKKLNVDHRTYKPDDYDLRICWL